MTLTQEQLDRVMRLPDHIRTNIWLNLMSTGDVDINEVRRAEGLDPDSLRPPDTDDEPWPVYVDRPRPAIALVMVAILAGFVLMALAALVAAANRIVGWLR